MLSTLRRKKNNPVIIFLLAVIILVFIAFFGTSMDNVMNPRLYAAKVNGHTISDQELATAYARRYREMQGRFQEFNRDLAKTMRLRETTLDQLITSYLIREDAEQRGLVVDDKALAEAIMNNEAFHTDGRFDRARYEMFLNGQQLAPSAFERAYRDQLLAEKLAAVLEGAVTVSQGEARLAYEKDAQSVELEFVRVPVKPYEAESGAVTEADATAWLQRPDAEEKVQKYFAKHKRTKYDVPKQVRARHILFRLEPGVDPNAKRQVEQRAREALKKVKSEGMDFAEAAKQLSEDSTKDKGGDLGFFSEGQMVRPFEEAAFGLKPGEISELVESPFGYHIIKVEEIKEPLVRRLEDVKDEIARALVVEDKAAEKAKARAAALLTAARAGESLEALVTAGAAQDPMPLKAETTGAFTRQGEFVPKIGANQAVADLAFQLTLESPFPPEPVAVDGAFLVLKLKDRTEPNDVEWDLIKTQVTERLVNEKKQKVLEAWTKRLRDRAEVEIHPLALSYDDDARAAARGGRDFGL